MRGMLTYARMADEESITTCNAFFQDGQLKGFSGLVFQSSSWSCPFGLAISILCSVVESFPSSPTSSPSCFSVLSIVEFASTILSLFNSATKCALYLSQRLINTLLRHTSAAVVHRCFERAALLSRRSIYTICPCVLVITDRAAPPTCE